MDKVFTNILQKCVCCEGTGFKKSNTIIIHNIISYIKSINAIGNKENINISIDEDFYNETSNVIIKKIKLIKLSFKVNFISKPNLKNIFEFEQELVDKVKTNTLEIINKNKTDDLKTDKSYRRKIKKKKSVEIQN